MIKEAKNKLQKNEAEKAAIKYTFPDHGIVVEATSLEEANQKLKNLLNNKQ